MSYEYFDYILDWPDKPTATIGAMVGNENTWRIDLWSQHQYRIMSDIQRYIDDGWEPVTEVGPSGFDIHYSGGFLGAHRYQLRSFCVKLRRSR